MYFNRFDICEAYYVYAMLWHNGQWSKEYSIFGRLNKMRCDVRDLASEQDLTDNGIEIYNDLVANPEKVRWEV